MSNEIQVFDFNGQAIKAIMIDGNPWFVAKDVCSALEISDTSQACERLDEDEKLVRTLYVSGQNRDVLIINESGLYSLTLTSNKPQAKTFKKWITSEVLPSIRKHGYYGQASRYDGFMSTELDEITNNKPFQRLNTAKYAELRKT